MENRTEQKTGKILLSILFMLMGALGIYMAKDWRVEVARFPIVASILVLVFASTDLLVTLFAQEKKRKIAIDADLTTELEPRLQLKRTLEIYGWMIGCGILILFLSFNIALPLLVFLYIKVVGRYSWRFSLLMAVSGWVFLYGLFTQMMHLPFPKGMLWQWVGLTVPVSISF